MSDAAWLASQQRTYNHSTYRWAADARVRAPRKQFKFEPWQLAVAIRVQEAKESK